MILTLRAELRCGGKRVHVDVWTATAGLRPLWVGYLSFDVGGWQLFGAALLLAQKSMPDHLLTVVIQGYLATESEPLPGGPASHEEEA